MSTSDRPPRVHDMMTRHPLVVHGEDDAEPLLALFEAHDFNAIPVVDAEDHLIGMVTKLSLLRLFRGGRATRSAEAGSPVSLRVGDVMDTRKVWVEPADGLDAVLRQSALVHHTVETNGFRYDKSRDGGRRTRLRRGHVSLLPRIPTS